MKQIQQLEHQLQALDNASLLRRRRTAETACTPPMQVDGQAMLAFCSNDYLGLAAHPRIVAALQEGATLYGAGSGASHLISGHSQAHALLEQRLANALSPYLTSARALYFCTGYMANLAILTALAAADSHTEIFSEQHNHASLIDGARLSKATVTIYPHSDTMALADLLNASTASNKIVVTDSVFSMDGDLAPLPDLLALCQQHDAWLVIDDAHGFGTLGARGLGALEHFQLQTPHIIYMGTLGKAAGVGGAFVAAHTSVIEWLIQRARPYIYTTAAAPALAHALLTSLDLMQSDEGMTRRQHLQKLIQQLQTSLSLQRWRLMPSNTAIQPLLVGSNAAAMQLSQQLYAQGLWVPAIRPPTVPEGTARLRITLSAAHTTQDVEKLVAALHVLEKA